MSKHAWDVCLLIVFCAELSFGAEPHDRSVPSGPTIWYVDWSAGGQNDGSSWTDAFTDLQDALGVAQASDEIWVAAGTYRPDRGTGDRSRFFDLPCGVALHGGFAGWEDCLDERDVSLNETILSGDLNDDDGPWNCDEVSNCCTEHEGVGCDDPACEAKVCAHDSQCCDPENPDPNYWRDRCAPLAWNACCHLGTWGTCDDSYRVLAIENCDQKSIVSCVSIVGGYYSWVSDPQVPYSANAGIVTEHAALDISNCTFRTTDTNGLFADFGSSIGLSNSLIKRSLVIRGDDFYGPSSITVERCNFEDAELIVYGDLTLKDSTFVDYLAGATVHGDSTVENCLFQNGNGLALWDGQHYLSQSTFLTNSSLTFQSSSAIVDNCKFLGNNSPVGGGSASVLFRNCVFANGHQMALRWAFGNLYVLNCTIVSNGVLSIGAFGAGIELQSNAAAQVLNSIIWGNGIPSSGQTREEDQLGVREDFGNSLEIDYSIVEGWTGRFGGDGNFDADPMLVNINGLDDLPGTVDDDARLMPDSPAIGAGLSTSLYLHSPDLDGHPRILCGNVDIGAYEFGAGDFNCDQAVDMLDHTAWPDCMTNPLRSAIRPGCEAFDFNADGDIDLEDFAYLQRLFVTP